MKCVFVVFVICLILQLQTCRVNAKNLEGIKTESENGVPVLNLRISDDDDKSKMVNNLTTDLTSTVNLNDDSVKEEESVTKEQLSTDGDLSIANNTNLEEEDSTSELKRIKKSNSLTTICVEIKPSSPYEPPYFMCRGTEPQNHPSYSSGGGGGYKPSSYGGSNSYKPDLNKGDGYGNEVDYRPNNDYGYGKPNYPPGSYGTHDEYISPGQNSYIKPKPIVPIRGDYVKPASLAHHQGGGGSGGYGKPNVYDSNPTYNNYGGGAGEGYIKPEKYQMAYDSYGPSQNSYGGKPIKYGGSSYNRPEYGMPTYDAQGPSTYEKPAGYYGTPGKQQYGGGATYGPPSYNQKPISSGYGRPPPGKYQPSYTSKKGSGGYQPQGGYRTIDEDDEVETEEMEMQNENSMGPELQSSYNPGLPVKYGAPPTSSYIPKYPPMYPQSAAKPYTYQSPTPQLPCGSNILVGCHPNVVPVPCYGSPSYNLPQPPVIFSAASPQTPSIIYGPPAAQQPIFYYPNLATPRQMASPDDDDDGTFGNQGQEPKKDMSDNQNSPTNAQGNDMSTQNAPEMKTEVNGQQDDDKIRKISDNAEKNAENGGQAAKSEEEKTRMDTDRAAADGASQDVELLKKSDDDVVQKTKIDSIMRMQQLQQMGQMMAGNGAAIQMRRDTNIRTRGDGHNLKRW